MNHAWRPLILIVGLAAVLLTVRMFLVPSDFMAKNGDYKYQWHRVGNEKFWRDEFTVKHKGREFCKQCHEDKIELVADSGHARVQCENCHVMFNPEKKGHPVDLKADFGYLLDIGIDRSRELCKRCHSKLPYRPKEFTSLTKGIKPFNMIDPQEHNPGEECVDCHDVHRTGFK
ncbi:MAG: cytochrome C [Nitrospirae bacterium]|nr:cytochrome C [Nitrospirota bacterium]